MDLQLIGLNHTTAPVEVREKVALPPEPREELLHVIRSEQVAEEALVLSTCNRTEFYLVRPFHEDPLPHLLHHVANIQEFEADEVSTDCFYHKKDLEAVRHLFRVASSLESQVVGEHEILGQVKNAYRQALEARTADFFLNRLLHRSFRAGKRVRSETDLCEGPASIAAAAVQMADKLVDLSEAKILLIGAGETAETAADSLINAGANKITVANRTLSRARELCHALSLPGQYNPDEPGPSPEARAHAPRKCAIEDPDAVNSHAIPLSQVDDCIADVDVVICSTAATDPVLGDNVRPLLKQRSTPIFIVDIAVPRDVDPEIGAMKGVHLRNIDDLESIVDGHAEQRERCVPHAESIVDEEIDTFHKWLDSLQVVPTIKQLKAHFEELCQEVLDQQPGNLSEEEQERLHDFGQRLCGKLLHDPFKHLQQTSKTQKQGQILHTVNVVHQLFDLDDPEE